MYISLAGGYRAALFSEFLFGKVKSGYRHIGVLDERYVVYPRYGNEVHFTVTASYGNEVKAIDCRVGVCGNEDVIDLVFLEGALCLKYCLG